MPEFIGQSINMSIQEAFEDAIRQAMVSKAVEVHGQLTSVEIRRVYAERTAQTSFRNVFVEIEAK